MRMPIRLMRDKGRDSLKMLKAITKSWGSREKRKERRMAKDEVHENKEETCPHT